MSLSRANCFQNHEDGSSKGADCVTHPEQLPSFANLSGLVAMNCTLGLCVRDYTGSVRDGVVHVTMTNGLALGLLPEESHAGMYKLLRLPCTVDSGTYDICNVSQIPSLPGRNFTTVNLDGGNVTAPLECFFATNADLPLAVSFMSGFYYRRKPGSRARTTRGGTFSLNSVDESSFCDTWYLEPLFRSGRPTAATVSSDVDGIAVGISSRMRAVGSNAYGDGPDVVLGTDPEDGLRAGRLAVAAVPGRGAAHRGLVRRGARHSQTLRGC